MRILTMSFALSMQSYTSPSNLALHSKRLRDIVKNASTYAGPTTIQKPMQVPIQVSTMQTSMQTPMIAPMQASAMQATIQVLIQTSMGRRLKVSFFNFRNNSRTQYEGNL